VVSNATILFSIGDSFRAAIWFDVTADRMVVESTGGGGHNKLEGRLVNVRPAATSATPAFDCQAYTTSADVTVGAAVYHRNAPTAEAASQNQSYFTNILAGQNLGQAAAASIPDRLGGRTTRAAVATVSGATVVVSMGTELLLTTAAVHSWVAKLQADATECEEDCVGTGRAASSKWWATFYDRSHIELAPAATPVPDPNDRWKSAPFLITRQMILQRYLTALQARSPYPIKVRPRFFV